METTQRVLLADIYSYCQRNKSISRDSELYKDTERQPDVSSASESDSVNHDSSVHDEQDQGGAHTAGEQLISGPPHLIQLQSPPNVQDELRTLTSDYPPSSRFTITRIDEDGQSDASPNDADEPLVLVENHFNDVSPLVNLSDDSGRQSVHQDASDTASEQLSQFSFLDMPPVPSSPLPDNCESSLNSDGGESVLVDLLLPESTNGQQTTGAVRGDGGWVVGEGTCS